MKNLKDNLIIAIVVVIIAYGLTTLVSCDYKAYKQRYPQAEPWTYLFHRGK